VLAESFACLVKLATFSAGECLHDLSGEQASGVKSDTLVHQLKQYVFSLLADGHKVPDLDHDFTTGQVCSRAFVRRPQFSSPREDQLALYYQLALPWRIDNGDLQHWLCSFTGDEGKTRTR